MSGKGGVYEYEAPRGWGSAPGWVICHPELTDLQVRIIITLSLFTSHRGDEWPTARELAALVRVKERATQDALAQMAVPIKRRYQKQEHAKRRNPNTPQLVEYVERFDSVTNAQLPGVWRLRFDRFDTGGPVIKVEVERKKRPSVASPTAVLALVTRDEDEGGGVQQNAPGGVQQNAPGGVQQTSPLGVQQTSPLGVQQSAPLLHSAQQTQIGQTPSVPLARQGGGQPRLPGLVTRAGRKPTRDERKLHKRLHASGATCHLCGKRFLFTDSPLELVSYGSERDGCAMHAACLEAHPDFSFSDYLEQQAAKVIEKNQMERQAREQREASELARLEVERRAWPERPSPIAQAGWEGLIQAAAGHLSGRLRRELVELVTPLCVESTAVVVELADWAQAETVRSRVRLCLRARYGDASRDVDVQVLPAVGRA